MKKIFRAKKMTSYIKKSKKIGRDELKKDDKKGGI